MQSAKYVGGWLAAAYGWQYPALLASVEIG